MTTQEKTLVALDPQGMQVSHDALLDWCDQRISDYMTMAEELQESAEHAKRGKVRHLPILRQADKHRKRAIYYQHVRAAIEAGYVIVPNFPAEAFAIRIKPGSFPPGCHRKRRQVSNWHTPSLESAKGLIEVGTGSYVNSEPEGDYTTRLVTIKRKDGTTESQLKRYYRPGFWKEVEFPIALVRPEIMKPVTEAMTKKIFDDFAVVGMEPKRSRRAYQDPIVVARIYGPKEGYSRRELTFFIAWWLDPESI